MFTGVSGSGQVLPGLRHPLRRGAAPLPGVRRAVRPPADPAGGRPAGGVDHRPAAGGGPAAAARRGERPVHRRHRDHAVELAADAVLPRRDLPAGRADGWTPTPSPPTPSPGPARSATGSGGCTWPPRSRWSRTPRSASASGRSPPGRVPGSARTCATSWPPSATTSTARGASWTRPTATGSCSPTRSRWSPSTPSARPGRIQRPYQGKYMSARRHVLHTLSDSRSATMRQRMLQFVQTVPCPVCAGHRLRPSRSRSRSPDTPSPTSPACRWPGWPRCCAHRGSGRCPVAGPDR